MVLNSFNEADVNWIYELELSERVNLMTSVDDRLELLLQPIFSLVGGVSVEKQYTEALVKFLKKNERKITHIYDAEYPAGWDRIDFRKDDVLLSKEVVEGNISLFEDITNDFHTKLIVSSTICNDFKVSKQEYDLALDANAPAWLKKLPQDDQIIISAAVDADFEILNTASFVSTVILQCTEESSQDKFCKKIQKLGLAMDVTGDIIRVYSAKQIFNKKAYTNSVTKVLKLAEKYGYEYDDWRLAEDVFDV